MAFSGFPASITISSGNINVISSALPAGAATEATLGSILADVNKLTFISSRLLVDGSGVTQPISASSLPLPTGAATESTLGSILTDLNNFVFISSRLLVDGSGVTQPISAASLPLPTGAATESTLGLIKSDLDRQTFIASRLLVDGSSVTQPVSGTVTANIGTTGGLATASQFPSALGQHISALSTSVVLASDQSAIPVTQSGTWATNQGSPNTLGNAWPVEITDGTNVLGTSSHPIRIDPTGTTTQPVSATQSGTWNINNISGTISLPTGASTSANQTTANTSLASIATSVSGISLSQGSTTSGEPGILQLGAVTTSSPSYITGQSSPISITLQGAIRVDATATTQPISGTVTANAGTGNFNVAQATAANLNATVTGNVAATQSGTWTTGRTWTLSSGSDSVSSVQSGTWTVQPGNTPNTTPWLFTISQGGNSAFVTVANALKVDGSAVTQPVSGTVTANQGSANATPWNQNISQWGGTSTTLGQKTSSASVPIVPASDFIPNLPSDLSTSGSISSLGGTVSLSIHDVVSGLATLSGTWSGSVQFEGLAPDGVTWVNLSTALVGGGSAFSSTAVTTNGTYRVAGLASYSQVRAIAMTFSSGPINVYLTASGAPDAISVRQSVAANLNAQVVGSIANGTSANPNPVIIGGRDDNGDAMTQDGSLVMSKHGLWVHTLPGEADLADDGLYFNTVVEFSLPTNGTETPIILVKNPLGSGKKIFVDDIQCDVITKGQQVTFRLYANPTVTANGTSLTISTSNIGGSSTTVMSAFSGPTTTSNGTKYRVFSVGLNSDSLDTTLDFGLEVQPNNEFIITGVPSAAAVTVAVSIRWAETT